MRKVILLSSVVVTGWMFGGFGESGDALAQCVNTTDCASLGYTESSCANGRLKCPFGDTWSCKETTSTPTEPEIPTRAILGTCTGYAKNCEVGWIFNNDGSCLPSKVDSRTPIGIIAYISSEGCGQSVSLYSMETVSSVAQAYRWATNPASETGVFRSNDVLEAVNDFGAVKIHKNSFLMKMPKLYILRLGLFIITLPLQIRKQRGNGVFRRLEF